MVRVFSWLPCLIDLSTAKSEISQAISRIIWMVLLSIYFCFTDHINDLQYTIVSYITISSLWFLWVKYDPCVGWRKYASVSLDQFLITLGLWYIGPLHTGVFLLYFWVILGNGYRFGSKLAWIASGIALVGIVSMIIFAPLWHAQLSHSAEIAVVFLLVTGFTYKILANLEDETGQRVALGIQVNTFTDRVMRDSLTGLCNREFVDKWLAKKKKKNSRVSILFLDLDKFKQFNDEYGHHVGDQVLINISKRLSNCVRENDVVCRYAGDEFIILLDDEDPETIKEIGHRITTALNQSVELEDGQRLTVTASIGVAIMGIHGNTPAEALRNADAAMYMAKRQGRNRMAWFEEKVKG